MVKISAAIWRCSCPCGPPGCYCCANVASGTLPVKGVLWVAMLDTLCGPLQWHPMKYASMLAEKMQKHDSTAWCAVCW